METIRVLLVDDRATIRRGLTMRLDLEPDMLVVGEAGNARDALAAAALLKPDVMVMDHELSDMDGAQAAQVLAAAGNDASVVILTIHDDSRTQRAAEQAGVFAFISKRQPNDQLVAAIRRAAATHGKEDRS